MTKRVVPVLVLPLVLASCSSSAPSPTPDTSGAVAPVALQMLALFQREDLGNSRAWIWMTWATKDGTAWIRRVSAVDLKPTKARHSSPVRETRWSMRLASGWWADAERLVDEHRFLTLSEKPMQDSNGAHAGSDRPTILVVPQVGAARTVSRSISDRDPDFDAVYDHINSLRKQVEAAKPEYEGTPQNDWRAPGFGSPRETLQK
jgi:hypothetical protein